MPDLNDGSYNTFYVPTPADAAGETRRRIAHLNAVEDRLAPILGRDATVALSDAITEVIGAIEREASARLLAALYAINHGEIDVFVAPEPEGEEEA